MSTELNNIFVSLRPLWVINQRLNHHAQDGRLLSGLRYDPTGTSIARGRDDFPYVQPYQMFEEEDTTVMGAIKGQVDVLKAQYLVSADSAFGLFRMDHTSQNLGVAEWVSLVRDAIETDVDDARTVDQVLKGTVTKPVRFRVIETFQEDMAWSMVIEVECWTRAMYPGNRSCYDE